MYVVARRCPADLLVRAMLADDERLENAFAWRWILDGKGGRSFGWCSRRSCFCGWAVQEGVGTLALLGNSPHNQTDMAIAVGMLIWSALSLGMSFPEAQVEGYGGGQQRTFAPVVVVKTANVKVFQEVAESFRDRCRVPVQFMNLQHDSADEAVRVRERVAGARLLVALGQPAAEILQGLRAHIVYAMVPVPPVGTIGTNSTIGPRESLGALHTLRPEIRHVGVIYTRHGLVKMPAARAVARVLGIELQEQMVDTSPDAIRAVHSMVVGRPDASGVQRPKVEALWVGPDPLVVDMPLLQYLLTLQLSARVPILAGTRQMVTHGALLSVDWSPEAVGQNLATQVNQILDDPHHYELNRDHPATVPDVTVNRQAARRLGIRLDAVMGLGWRILE